MAFRSFQLQALIRLLLLVANCIALTYVWQLHAYWFTLWNLGLLVLLQVFLFFRFLTRWQRDLGAFASSVRFGDYTITYNMLQKSDAYYELFTMLNDVSRHVRDVQSKHEQQNQYLQYVVENSRIGLLAYDDKGDIVLSNREALELMRSPRIKNIHELKKTDYDLHEIFTSQGFNQPRVISFAKPAAKVSVRLSKFILDGQTVFLLSLINIKSELEQNEMQSWQELISVLTHEIMNSVSPIHSLSGSMNKFLDRVEGNQEAISKAKNSLEVISRRSRSLMGFVDRYRKISTVPLPHLKPFNVADLVQSVLTLLQEELSSVTISVTHNNQVITADFQQLEQVMINLLKNAVHAMDNTDNKQIGIHVHAGDLSTRIELKDNGRGIPPSTMDKIFIPFFTSRSDGSGIGLTISRQIMHRHGGSIEAYSEEGEGSTFVLSFPMN